MIAFSNIVKKSIWKAFAFVTVVEQRVYRDGPVIFIVALQNFQQDLNLKVGGIIFIKLCKPLAEKYWKKEMILNESEDEKIYRTSLDKTKFKTSKIRKEFCVTELFDSAFGSSVFLAKIEVVTQEGPDLTISVASVDAEDPIPYKPYWFPGDHLEVGAVVFSTEVLYGGKK